MTVAKIIYPLPPVNRKGNNFSWTTSHSSEHMLKKIYTRCQLCSFSDHPTCIHLLLLHTIVCTCHHLSIERMKAVCIRKVCSHIVNSFSTNFRGNSFSRIRVTVVHYFSIYIHEKFAGINIREHNCILKSIMFSNRKLIKLKIGYLWGSKIYGSFWLVTAGSATAKNWVKK